MLYMKEKIIELRKNGLNYNEISNKLKCSKSTVSYHCSKIPNNEDIKIQNGFRPKKEKIIKPTFEKKCLICGEIFLTKRKEQTSCSKECRKVFRKKYLKNRNYEYENLINWRLDIKKKAVEYKGGKCVVCDYNKCLRSLDFHHLDPTQKEFSISKNKNRKFEDLKIELDKCILVCSNCHGEIHDNIIKMPM